MGNSPLFATFTTEQIIKKKNITASKYFTPTDDYVRLLFHVFRDKYFDGQLPYTEVSTVNAK